MKKLMYIFSEPRSFGVRTTQPRRSSSGVVASTPLFIRGSLNMYRLILLLLMLCLLCSCFQGQPINYPFDDVSAVLKETFMKGEKKFQAVLPELEEEPDYMYMYIQNNINFYILLKTKIKLKKDEENTSQIMIRINEHNRQWNYDKRLEDMEKDFFKCLEQRMKTGRWGTLPWVIKYKKKKNDS